MGLAEGSRVSIPFTATEDPSDVFSATFWDEIFLGICERATTQILGVSDYTALAIADAVEMLKTAQLVDWTDISGSDRLAALNLVLTFNLESYRDALSGAVADPSALGYFSALFDGTATQGNRNAYQWMPRYRDNPPTKGGTIETYGEQVSGDIFGPWIIDAYQSLLSRIRYCDCAPDTSDGTGNYVASWQTSLMSGVPIQQFISGVSKRFHIYSASFGSLLHTSAWTTAGYYTYAGSPTTNYTAIVEFAGTNSNL